MWNKIGNAASKVSSFIVFIAMRLLWIDVTLKNVIDGRYESTKSDVTRSQIKYSKVDTKAILAYAKNVADETDSSISSGRGKTQSLLTLTAFFLGALTFITRNGSANSIWISVAFGFVTIAALLLHRSLRVNWFGRLSLQAKDLIDKREGKFERLHAADLLQNALRNDGAARFVVSVLRGAMRALLIALAATIIAALWPNPSATVDEIALAEASARCETRVLTDAARRQCEEGKSDALRDITQDEPAWYWSGIPDRTTPIVDRLMRERYGIRRVFQWENNDDRIFYTESYNESVIALLSPRFGTDFADRVYAEARAEVEAIFPGDDVLNPEVLQAGRVPTGSCLGRTEQCFVRIFFETAPSGNPVGLRVAYSPDSTLNMRALAAASRMLFRPARDLARGRSGGAHSVAIWFTTS